MVGVAVRPGVDVDGWFEAEWESRRLGFPAGPGPSVARLDTGETSQQTYEKLGEESQQAREKSRRLKAYYHVELVRLLDGMVGEQHGVLARVVGEKWLSAVKRCPGSVRRHIVPCGRLSFKGAKCDFPLCPWCQARRSRRLRRVIGPLVADMSERKLWTFSPPNLEHLTSEGVSDMGKSLTGLHRLSGVKQACRGGVRSIEVTSTGNGWNLHAHEAVDSGWVAHYPQTDIEPVYLFGADRVARFARWRVVKRHEGLAKLFTEQCQKFETLRGLGHCLAGREHPGGHDYESCPDCWYFVDMRVADVNVADEIAKYVTKGSQVVGAGAAAVVEYLFAVKGKRLVQTFGNLHGVKLEDVEDKAEVPERDGECPWPDCPDPGGGRWEYVGPGYPVGAVLEHNHETGTARVIYPPGSGHYSSGGVPGSEGGKGRG